MKKRVLSLIWTIAIIMIYTSTCFAWGGISIDVSPQAPSGLDTNIGNVLGVVQWIGFAVAIVMVIYVGIRYLTSGAGEKAKVKDTMIPLLVGAVLIALAPQIVEAVFNTLGGNS